MRNRTVLKLSTAVALTALLSGAMATGSQAAVAESTRPRPAATTNSGVPALVDPDKGLAAQTPEIQGRWTDNIYFSSRVKAGGQDIGVVVQTVSAHNAQPRIVSFAVTNVTTGWYKNEAIVVNPNDYNWSTTGLDISAPGLKWTGNAQQMNLSIKVPWGSFNVTAKSRGPALYYGGTGAFSLFGQTNHEYALPDLQTTGTLEIDGKSRRVTGRSWLDRQWGVIPSDPNGRWRWTWMNFNMPNGDSVVLYDAVSNDGENAWATVVRRDGTHEVVPVEPLARRADRYYTSSTSGDRYPTRWRVNIPALGARLTVTVSGPRKQEITQGSGGRMEATTSFTGVYKGRSVTGKNNVKLIGDWKPATSTPTPQSS